MVTPHGNAWRDRALTGGLYVRNAVTRPREFRDRVTGRRARQAMTPPPVLAAEALDPVDAAHRLIGIGTAGVQPDQQCCRAELAVVSARTFARLPSGHHHDAGSGLAELLWVVVRHARPAAVVETGVARGVSSAFVLDAMRANGHGHLWSIDLPPITPGWGAQTGSAVAPELRGRWTYVRGASARHLARVLRAAGPVALFVHDGLHTRDNVLFELRTAWAALTPDGLLLSDDADDTDAVLSFAAEIGRPPLLVREPGKDDVLAAWTRSPADGRG